MTKTNHKLGVVVPYRDRYDQLVSFKRKMSDYLNKRDIDYVLIIVEQDDAKLFNRGKLLNIGFIRAEKEGCDYVVFHDIDMVPIKVDYTYSDVPVHLATDLLDEGSGKKADIFDTYFGGVTIFPVNAFRIINGYSNDYWGWGFEDDDLFLRCVQKKIPHDVLHVNTQGGSNVSLRLNGIDSYLKTKFKGDLSNKTTIIVNLDVDGIKCDPESEYDRYTILSIPNIGLTISYDSFRRYKFLLNEGIGSWFYIDSDIMQNHKLTLSVTIDNHTKSVKFYNNGDLIGSKKLTKSLRNIRNSDLFIGSKNGKEEFFGGTISQVAIFDEILKPKELKTISENEVYSLSMPFGDYHSDGNLIQYYDMKFIKSYKVMDLCDYDNPAEIIKGEIIKSDMVKETIINVPFRRRGYFEVMHHKSSGYDGGVWSDINIRYNQLRFYNEMSQGYRPTMNDGLTTCDYKVWDETSINKQIHMNVSV